jgi:hypothetical protein
MIGRVTGLWIIGGDHWFADYRAFGIARSSRFRRQKVTKIHLICCRLRYPIRMVSALVHRLRAIDDQYSCIVLAPFANASGREMPFLRKLRAGVVHFVAL